MSPGLVRVSGWPYPLEIVQNDTQVTILYESYHEVRRIFLDGRGYPETLPHRAMGYSLGHWEGSTLVVETKMLTAGYVDLGGPAALGELARRRAHVAQRGRPGAAQRAHALRSRELPAARHAPPLVAPEPDT